MNPRITALTPLQPGAISRPVSATGRPMAGRQGPRRPLSERLAMPALMASESRANHPAMVLPASLTVGLPSPPAPSDPQLARSERLLQAARPLTLRMLNEPLWHTPQGTQTPPHDEDIDLSRIFGTGFGPSAQALIITGPENRVRSYSKRRRWALTLASTPAQVGHDPLLCCMEFKRFGHETQQAYRQRVELELNQLRRFNRDIEVVDLLESQDGLLLARMTNLPEEAGFWLHELAQRQIDELPLEQTAGQKTPYVAAVYGLFADVAAKLWADYHLQGFIHGDVKLANVMLTGDGRPSIIDNGETRAVQGDGCVEAHITTYWPPEAAIGGRFGTAGDVHALGQSMLAAMGQLAESMAAHKGGDQARKEARDDLDRLHIALQTPQSAFYSWRAHLIDGGRQAAHEPDWLLFERATALFRHSAPQLWAHWLTRMVHPEPHQRASLDETANLLDMLLTTQLPEHLETVRDHTSDILEASKSNEIHPQLLDISLQRARRLALQ